MTRWLALFPSLPAPLLFPREACLMLQWLWVKVETSQTSMDARGHLLLFLKFLHHQRLLSNFMRIVYILNTGRPCFIALYCALQRLHFLERKIVATLQCQIIISIFFFLVITYFFKVSTLVFKKHNAKKI